MQPKDLQATQHIVTQLLSTSKPPRYTMPCTPNSGTVTIKSGQKKSFSTLQNANYSYSTFLKMRNSPPHNRLLSHVQSPLGKERDSRKKEWRTVSSVWEKRLAIILSGAVADRVYPGCEKTLALWFLRTNHPLDRCNKPWSEGQNSNSI